MGKLRQMFARFESTCGSCHGTIREGDAIARPYARNTAGGNVFASSWYCRRCAVVVQRLSDAGYFSGARFISEKARAAFFERQDVRSALAEFKSLDEGGRDEGSS